MKHETSCFWKPFGRQRVKAPKVSAGWICLPLKCLCTKCWLWAIAVSEGGDSTLWIFFFLLKLSSLWVFGEKLFWSCKTSFGRIFLSLKYFFWLIVHKHHKKWSFPLRISSVNTADLVTFTEEILNGKLYFLCTKCQLRGITVLEGGRDILWILLICFGFITSITGKLF